MAKMLLGGGRRRRETTFALIFLSDGLQTVDNLKLFVFKLYSKLLVTTQFNLSKRLTTIAFNSRDMTTIICFLADKEEKQSIRNIKEDKVL